MKNNCSCCRFDFEEHEIEFVNQDELHQMLLELRELLNTNTNNVFESEINSIESNVSDKTEIVFNDIVYLIDCENQIFDKVCNFRIGRYEPETEMIIFE